MSLSLEASIRTCKVDTAYANKVQSDRFINPANMVCPVWNGRDTAGRQVCKDSFYTKRAGCNSAEDRVMVENSLRPQYYEYVNLSSEGVGGDMYSSKEMTHADVVKASKEMQQLYSRNPHFNGVLQGSIYPSCSSNRYSQAVAEEAQKNRGKQYKNSSMEGFERMRCGGF